MPNPTELCTTLRMSVIDKYAHTTATDVHAVGEAAEAHLKTRPKTPSYSFPKGERDGLRPSEFGVGTPRRELACVFCVEEAGPCAVVSHCGYALMKLVPRFSSMQAPRPPPAPTTTPISTPRSRGRFTRTFTAPR